MTTGKIIFTSALTTIAVLLTLGAAAIFAARSTIDALVPEARLASTLFHGHPGHREVAWGRAGGGVCTRLDEGHITGHTNEVSRWVQAELTLTPPQTAALDGVATEVGDWIQSLRPLCDSPPQDAPGHVAAVVQLTDTTHAAMQRISLAFDAFYASLDPAQQSKLDGWFVHEHDSRS